MTSCPHTLLVTLRVCATALSRAARWTPRLFGAVVGVQLLLAITPAAQVLAASWLTSTLSRSGSAPVLPLAATAAATGGVLLLQGLLLDVGQSQASEQHTRFFAQLRDVVAHMPASELAGDETATRIQSARSAIDYTMNGLARNVVAVIGAALTGVTLMLSLWHVSPLAAGLVALSLVPSLVAYSVIASFRRSVVHDMNRLERSQRYFTDQLVYQRTGTELASLGTSGRMAEWADAESRASTALVHAFTSRSAASHAAAGLVTTAIVLAALWSLGGHTASNGAVAGVLGVVSGTAVVSGAGASFGQIMTAVPLMEVYEEVVLGSRRVEAAAPRRHVGELAVDELVVRYRGRGDDALRDVSLRVRQGELVALVGVNGAGKTTLVHAMLGLVPTIGGRVALDGKDLATVPESERLSYFGLLTQEFGRYEVTVRQALLLGSCEPDISDERLWSALAMANAATMVRALPQGLDTRLGQQWGGVGISGGQWQRLALARVYLRDAGVWILDEPTSAIDAQSEQAIFDELAAHKAGRITIVVTHRASTLRRMDRIYVIDGGSLVEQGSYRELMAARGCLARIFASEDVG